MGFARENVNNKYFRADIPLRAFDLGDQIQYYLILDYSDRATTYLGVSKDDPSGWYSAAMASVEAAQASPFSFTIGTQNEQKPFEYLTGGRKIRGQWSEVFELPNVGAHAHLLPTGKDAGKVLMWGRRDTAKQSMNTFPANPHGPDEPRADPATCTPFILDPIKKTWRLTKQPFMPDRGRANMNLPKTTDGNNKINANLFCSGHAFQQDGKLVVGGGHIYDERGLDQACTYDPEKDIWEAVPVKTDGTVMGNGRWYPTVIALPTGATLVAAGSYAAAGNDDRIIQNTDTQILSIDAQNLTTARFASIQPIPGIVPELYPRLHVASSGIIYWISSLDIKYLDQAKSEQWQLLNPAQMNVNTNTPPRSSRDYAPSVMYDKDKVVYIGGGTPPTATTETLDFSDPSKVVRGASGNMVFPRRQHNATVLPDGSVLVTGGTRGNGDDAADFANDLRFNDLRPGRPVHIAELWNPGDGQGTWSTMVSEQIDRCYHGTAVLLPDARVLSAGGGEFQLTQYGPGGKRVFANPEKDSQRNAQIFSPPYLFKDGPRPKIDSINPALKIIECSPVSTFEVGTSEPTKIRKVNLIGLTSVTHSLNSSQRLVPLKFTKNKKSPTVKSPLNARSCPPGYYMLFLIDNDGVPSVAEFVKIVPTAIASQRHTAFTESIVAKAFVPTTALEKRQEIRAIPSRTRIEIGITATCPYGLSACWGIAYEALSKLSGVDDVDPIPHRSGSTASVYLIDNNVPDLDIWTRQFKELVRDTYSLRGYEAAVLGRVEARDGELVLLADDPRPEVRLVPLEAGSKVQRDGNTGDSQVTIEEELVAYNDLLQAVSADDAGLYRVTGPMSAIETGHSIQVRLFELM